MSAEQIPNGNHVVPDYQIEALRNERVHHVSRLNAYRVTTMGGFGRRLAIAYNVLHQRQLVSASVTGWAERVRADMAARNESSIPSVGAMRRQRAREIFELDEKAARRQQTKALSEGKGTRLPWRRNVYLREWIKDEKNKIKEIDKQLLPN